MIRYLPVAMNVEGWRCLVVGGGTVAARRVESLLEAGALVTVAAPRISPSLARLAESAVIHHVASTYQPALLADIRLVVAATDRPEVNSAVTEDARLRGILVNDAETPERGDFVIPSVLRRDELLISVTTGGGSPALARGIRDRLASQFGPEWGDYVALLRETRQLVLGAVEDAARRKEILNAVASDETLLSLLREGRGDEARARAHSCISQL